MDFRDALKMLRGQHDAVKRRLLNNQNTFFTVRHDSISGAADADSTGDQIKSPNATAEMIAKLKQYGVDESEIRTRFSNNMDLYKTCLDIFLTEDNTSVLKNAMERKNYETAFDAAHDLKGLSGNLGLIPYYKAIRALVEALRSGDYALAQTLNISVQTQFDILRRLMNSEMTGK